eukprot:2031752-Pyramimonas_sp.AAC.1
MARGLAACALVLAFVLAASALARVRDLVFRALSANIQCSSDHRIARSLFVAAVLADLRIAVLAMLLISARGTAAFNVAIAAQLVLE